MTPLRHHTKLAYGLGQAAEGIANTAYGTFLLVFYNQALGLPAALAGLAIFVSLTVDAVSDPLMGTISDGTRHRWGPRHPYIFASALPLALFFAVSFSPPAGMADPELFAWMTVTLVAARLAKTAFNVPYLALGAELSADYVERAAIVAYRSFFSLFGSVIAVVFAQQLFLMPTDAIPNAQLNPSGYAAMGAALAMVIFTAILMSGLGTMSEASRLRRPESKPATAPIHFYRDVLEVLTCRSFRYLFGATLLFSVGIGADTSLRIYLGTYFWHLGSAEVLQLPLWSLLGVVAGLPAMTALVRRFEKKTIFVTGLGWYATIAVVMPLAEIAGVLPGAGDPLRSAVIFGAAFIAALGAAGGMVTGGAMLADVVDEHCLAVGQHREGVFFGALSFANKAAVGLGGALAGAILWIISFPAQAGPDTILHETAAALGVLGGSSVGLVMLCGVLVLLPYNLGRVELAGIRAALDAQRPRSVE